MSDERFELDVRLDMPKLLIDNATNKRYHLLLVNDIEEIVGLLNNLHQENNILNKNEDDLKECTIENIKLKEENEKLTKMLNANYKTNNELVQYIQMLERDKDE